MTSFGYDDLLRRVKDLRITPPGDMTAEELRGWLNGYLAAMKNLETVIAGLKKGADNCRGN